MFGYKAGSEAIMDFLEKGILNKLIKGASIMGCMVMGGLIVNYVKAVCGLKIVSSTTTYSIQTNFLDQVCPSILPLAVTTLVFLKDHWTDRSDRYRWWYHRNLSILEITRREAFASLRY